MKKNIVKLLVLVVALMSVLFAFASCGCSHEEEVIPAKEATCAAEGLTEGKKCKLCGEILVKQEPVAKKEHAYQNVEKQDATCEEDGFEAGVKCLVCGDVKSGCEVIPAGHVTIDIAENPAKCYATGTAAGKRCTVCLKDVEGFEELPMIPHNLQDVDAIDATCVAAGSSAGKKCTTEGCSYFEGLTTIDPLGHKPVAANKLEPTCTTDGHEAGTVCERCEAVIDGCAVIPMLGHSIKNENITITKEPDLGIVGEGTATCDVCKKEVTLEIPAKLGGRWDYTSDTDTLYMSKTGAAGFVNELVNDTETGRTYVKVGINNPGIHPNSPEKPADAILAQIGEANFVWRPNENVTLGEMRADNMFVFTTDIQIASAITKWVPTGTQYDNQNGPDKYYEGWLFNPSVSTNPSTTSTDDKSNNHVGTNPVHKDKTTSGELASVKIGNAVLDVAKWYNLKLVYRLADDNVKQYIVEIYVDGNLAATTNPTDHRANVTGNPILDFRIKFKNARCFDELIFYFDNTTFEELPYTPATPDEPGTPDTPDTPTPGYAWNYTSDADTLNVGNNSTGVARQELVNEDGKTYVKFIIDNKCGYSDGASKKNEVVISWKPVTETPLEAMNTGKVQYIFKTKVNFQSVVTKLIPAKVTDNSADYDQYYNNWLMNLCLSTNTNQNNSGDNFNISINFNPVYADNDATKSGALVSLKRDKEIVPIGEWIELTYVFTPNAANADKVDWYVMLGDKVISSGTATPKAEFIGKPITDFRIKFKNTRVYDEVIILFDDTTFQALPYCAHTLGEEVTEVVAPQVGVPGKGTAVCTKCGATVEVEIPALPEPDFDLTIEEAIAMGQTFEHNTFSTDKYYVTGVITEVYNTTYGNMKIKDEAGNILIVYGTFSADGATRYDKLETKPVAGDTVTVYGVVGKYNTDSQLKNAWITEHTAHTCDFDAATCTAPKTCKLCGKTEGEALAHNYVDGTCTACGAKDNVTPPADVVPAPGKAYILTANNANGAVYFAGSLMSGRFNGTIDQAAATVVYVEEGATEGTYYLYFMMNGTTKKYLKVTDASTGAGFADTASAATVFEWNATRKTMVVADDSNNRALALDPTKTFTTFSTYDASQTNYDYAEFVEVEVPEQPGDSEDSEDKPVTPGIGGIGGLGGLGGI